MNGPETFDITDLNEVAAAVPKYPATSSKIAEEARKRKAPRNVVRFFESIPLATFESQQDVMIRAEEARILMEEEQVEPPEQLRSYD